MYFPQSPGSDFSRSSSDFSSWENIFDEVSSPKESSSTVPSFNSSTEKTEDVYKMKIQDFEYSDIYEGFSFSPKGDDSFSKYCLTQTSSTDTPPSKKKGTKRKICNSVDSSESVKTAFATMSTSEGIPSSTSSRSITVVTNDSKSKKASTIDTMQSSATTSVKNPLKAEGNIFFIPLKVVSTEQKLSLEKEVEQYRAAVKKFKNDPNFTVWKCAKAVINAYNLIIHSEVITDIDKNFKELFGKECSEVELNKNVEDECLFLLTKDPVKKFQEPFEQYQAVLKKFGKEVNGDFAIESIIKLYDLKSQLNPEKSSVISTFKQYYTDYCSKWTLEDVALDMDVELDYTKSYSKNPKCKKSLKANALNYQELKKPIQQFHALIKKFSQKPHNIHFSINRCTRAIMMAYPMIKLTAVKYHYENYEKYFNKVCPDEKIESTVEVAYEKTRPKSKKKGKNK